MDADRDAGVPDATADDSGPLDASMPDSGRMGWWGSSTFYEIFVRSFADSNGDGIGDFRGIISRLDELNDGNPSTTNDLGIDGIWLMPIHPSPSYHGYDVTNYRDINPNYGSLEDFDAFIQACHARGIRVIIDFVLNHSSSQHPWFVDAKSSPSSAHRNYYSWASTPPAWGRPWDGGPVWHRTDTGWYYGLFWSGMPDLNLAHPELEQEMTETARFWLDRGVDGFRVDAARYLFEGPDGQLSNRPETHAFIQRLRANLATQYPEALFVAEAWADLDEIASYHGDGKEYQLAFQFDLSDAIKASVYDAVKANINQASSGMIAAFSDLSYAAPFLSNHDQTRVMRAFDGLDARARIAAALLFAMPGTPFLYYGEEIGMRGGSQPRDEDKRTPMRWTDQAPAYGFSTSARTWYEVGTSTRATELPGVDVATQRANPTSLWNLYRQLIGLRKSHPALSGAYTLPKVTNPQRGIVAFVREMAGERILFVANLHFQPATAFSVAVHGRPRTLFSEGVTEVARGGDRFALDGMGPQSFAFYVLDPE